MNVQRMRLKKLNNTRDLGGFPVADGKKIKRDKLIRSGRMHKLPPQTVSALLKKGLTTIIDLRTEREQHEYPDTKINGVKTVNLPLVCTATVGITYTKSMARTMLDESKRIKTEFGTADNYMSSMYETVLFGDDGRRSLKEFFKILLEAEGCVIWHCNAGKDRTGLCAMLLEFVLGVDEKLIIEDYCASKKFQHTRRFWQKAALVIAPMPRRFKHILIALMEAKPQYIIGAIDKIKELYGSVTEYCKQSLGLTDEQIEILKSKYTE